jgi:hypothetical protein
VSAREEAALLFSGGTDSTCAAALAAARHERVHLLTFRELATRRSPVPEGNAARLRARYGAERFPHRVIDVDPLVRRLAYGDYARALRRHGLFLLATPGFSTLAWHARAIAYCLDRGIPRCLDGLTRELMHFPGHMDWFVEAARGLYARFGIAYENPVREWPVPPDQQLLGRFVVGRHPELTEWTPEAAEGTTGMYLYKEGLFPHPNVKGTRLDRSMQADCYPFVLYHLFAFWYYLPARGPELFEAGLRGLFAEKMELAASWLEDYRRRGRDSVMGPCLAD